MSHPPAAETLGVTLPASTDEIEAAFRRALTTHHPDVGGSAEQTRLIIEARAILLGGTGAPYNSAPAPGRSRTFVKRRRFR